MPTYYTPPPTPPPALPSPAPLPSQPDSWSRSDDVYSQSHSSKSSSSSKSKSHSSSHRDSHGKHDDESHSHKIPYAFLGSIAAAAYLAHKCWPKGFLYGDKEDWELSSHARRTRERMREEQEAKRREKHRFGSSPDHPPPPPPPHDREQRRAGYRSSATAGIGAGVGAGSYYSREEEETESEIYRGRDPRDRGRRLPPPPPARSLSKDREFDRYSEIDDPRGGTRNGNIHRRAPSRERSITRNGSDIVPSERPSRREHDSYYPPAPQRYVIERSSLVTGLRHSDPDVGRPAPRYLLESRASAASDPIFHRTETVRQRPRYYEDDLPARASEVVHVYRDSPPPSRARRASMDTGSGRRYDGDYDWRYR